jgi:hypothetical protein
MIIHYETDYNDYGLASHDENEMTSLPPANTIKDPLGTGVNSPPGPPKSRDRPFINQKKT